MTSLESFFGGGGGKSISWKDQPIGTTIRGTVKRVHEPSQQTDFVTKELKFKPKTGEPVMQVRIDLATDMRDPSDAEDDGSRGLYCSGWLIGAVGDAVGKAGIKNGVPEVGGVLTVQLSEKCPSDNPNLPPYNKYVAHYQPAPAVGTQQLFMQQPAQQFVPQQLPPQQFVPQPIPQPSISGLGYVQQPGMVSGGGVGTTAGAPGGSVGGGIPPAVAQAFPQAQVVGQQPMPQGFQTTQQEVAQQAAPAKPEAISDVAWSQMDDAQKRSVAETFASLPPF